MDTAGELFEQHRAALAATAYRMLGNRTDADDVLQQAWIRWSRADQSMLIRRQNIPCGWSTLSGTD